MSCSAIWLPTKTLLKKFLSIMHPKTSYILMQVPWVQMRSWLINIPKTSLTATTLSQNFKQSSNFWQVPTTLIINKDNFLQYYVPVNSNSNLTILFIFDQEKLNEFLTQYQLLTDQDITLYQNGTLFATTAKNLAKLDKKTNLISSQKNSEHH